MNISTEHIQHPTSKYQSDSVKAGQGRFRSKRGWRIDDGGWQKAASSTPNIQLPTPSQGQSRPVKVSQGRSSLATRKDSWYFRVIPRISGYFRVLEKKRESILRRKSRARSGDPLDKVEARGKRRGKYLPGCSLPRVRSLSPKRVVLGVIFRTFRNVRVEPIIRTRMGRFQGIVSTGSGESRRASPWEIATFISSSRESMAGFGPAKLQMVHI